MILLSSLYAKFRPDPVAEIGRAVNDEVGVTNGDWVEVQTAAGWTTFKAVVSDTMHPYTVCVPHGWHGEHNANRLTDHQLCDPVAGTPAYKDLRCRVRSLAIGNKP